MQEKIWWFSANVNEDPAIPCTAGLSVKERSLISVWLTAREKGGPAPAAMTWAAEACLGIKPRARHTGARKIDGGKLGPLMRAISEVKKARPEIFAWLMTQSGSRLAKAGLARYASDLAGLTWLEKAPGRAKSLEERLIAYELQFMLREKKAFMYNRAERNYLPDLNRMRGPAKLKAMLAALGARLELSGKGFVRFVPVEKAVEKPVEKKPAAEETPAPVEKKAAPVEAPGWLLAAAGQAGIQPSKEDLARILKAVELLKAQSFPLGGRMAKCQDRAEWEKLETEKKELVGATRRLLARWRGSCPAAAGVLEKALDQGIQIGQNPLGYLRAWMEGRV